MSDFNAKVIEEFRANEGRVGGPFEGGDLLLLHSTGRRSGAERVSPLAYVREDDGWAVAGSAAGADTDPAWVHNLEAAPDTTIEVGTETVPVRATVVRDGTERRRLYDAMVGIMPGFADYETKTTRVIPMVVLERR